MSNLSVVATLRLFNRAFLAAYGVDGVAALATGTFTAYVFNAAYHGFCEAAGPIIAYKAGTGDMAALRRAIRAGTTAIAAVSAAAFLLSNAGADIIIRRFAPENAALRALLAAHYPAYAFSLLFLGLNLFLAYVLSATERGHCAAGLSLVRTFVLPTAALFALPLLFEADGLWLAVPAAECLTLLLAALLLGLPARSSRASLATGG